jgi:hypothetical protein
MFPHQVSVVHEGGRVYFGSSGWAEFVAAERISCFDVGLFVLLRPSRFVMRLYGHNGCRCHFGPLVAHPLSSRLRLLHWLLFSRRRVHNCMVMQLALLLLFPLLPLLQMSKCRRPHTHPLLVDQGPLRLVLLLLLLFPALYRLSHTYKVLTTSFIPSAVRVLDALIICTNTSHLFPGSSRAFTWDAVRSRTQGPHDSTHNSGSC